LSVAFSANEGVRQQRDGLTPEPTSSVDRAGAVPPAAEMALE